MSAAGTVLLVSNHAEVVGGGEESFLTLLQGLDRSRWTPVVAVPGEGVVSRRCRALGVPVSIVELPSLRRPGPAIVRSVLALRRLADAVGADLVHANGSRAMLFAGLAVRLDGIPVVWHLRMIDPDPWLDWLLVRLATRIVVTSEAVRGRLDRWPRAVERSVTIPNGLDVDGFVPAREPAAVRAALGLPAGARVVGVVGRLVAFKGHRHLLDAFVRVAQAHPAAHLLVVGDGPERAALERQAAALGLAGRVLFTGHRDDVADLMAAMDVFALPSLGEPFGRVLLEAMALARPVVATAAGGVPEVVEDGVTGLLVEPADAEALAAAVTGMLAHPAQAAALGRAGRQHLEASFGLRHHAAQVEAVWEEVTEP